MSVVFFFNDTATTEIYTLSLHDALPISGPESGPVRRPTAGGSTIAPRRRSVATLSWVAGCSHISVCMAGANTTGQCAVSRLARSEEHTSELQSRQYLVCRLLLEKKQNSS